MLACGGRERERAPIFLKNNNDSFSSMVEIEKTLNDDSLHGPFISVSIVDYFGGGADHIVKAASHVTCGVILNY